jgi:hypothetical protein
MTTMPRRVAGLVLSHQELAEQVRERFVRKLTFTGFSVAEYKLAFDATSRGLLACITTLVVDLSMADWLKFWGVRWRNKQGLPLDTPCMRLLEMPNLQVLETVFRRSEPDENPDQIPLLFGCHDVVLDLVLKNMAMFTTDLRAVVISGEVRAGVAIDFEFRRWRLAESPCETLGPYVMPPPLHHYERIESDFDELKR